MFAKLKHIAAVALIYYHISLLAPLVAAQDICFSNTTESQKSCLNAIRSDRRSGYARGQIVPVYVTVSFSEGNEDDVALDTLPRTVRFLPKVDRYTNLSIADSKLWYIIQVII